MFTYVKTVLRGFLHIRSMHVSIELNFGGIIWRFRSLQVADYTTSHQKSNTHIKLIIQPNQFPFLDEIILRDKYWKPDPFFLQANSRIQNARNLVL